MNLPPDVLKNVLAIQAARHQGQHQLAASLTSTTLKQLESGYETKSIDALKLMAGLNMDLGNYRAESGEVVGAEKAFLKAKDIFSRQELNSLQECDLSLIHI